MVHSIRYSAVFPQHLFNKNIQEKKNTSVAYRCLSQALLHAIIEMRIMEDEGRKQREHRRQRAEDKKSEVMQGKGRELRTWKA